MEEFVNKLRYEEIAVFVPGDVEYERSVATANLLYRYSRPGCVVQPKRASQVQLVVREAKELGHTITIKNGGHSYAGFSTAGAGISLDLIKMNAVSLDTKSQTVTLQGGALWGHAYRQLVNNHLDTLVINGGRCPTVGVSGFLLGGGLGPFSRSLGMGCDSVKEFTIVTADGNLVKVSENDDIKSDKGQLFWALRGAGGGNFGVVVESKMKVQKLSSTEVVAGRFTWGPKPTAIDDFIHTMNDFYTTDWPEQLTIDSSWLCDLKETKSPIQVRFLVYYDGTEADFDQIISTHIKEDELAKQLQRRTLPEQSTRFLHETLVSQWSEEITKAFPSNKSYSIYTSFVFQNDRARIEQITKVIREEMAAFREKMLGETALLQVTWIHAGGKISDRDGAATAFHWREGIYHSYIMIQWEEKYLEKDMRGFLNRFKARLRPFSIKEQALFINFPDEALTQDTHEQAYYGANYEQLRRVKRVWDKDNYFKWSQGVQLPQATPSEPPELLKDKVVEENLTDRFAAMHWDGFVPPPPYSSLDTKSYNPGSSSIGAVGGLTGFDFVGGLTDLGF